MTSHGETFGILEGKEEEMTKLKEKLNTLDPRNEFNHP